MADEPVDPLQAIADAHLKRMQEIADESFTKVKEACADSLDRLKRTVGLRDAVLDKTLTALGVTQPGEKEDAGVIAGKPAED
jgi:hypothetical protein